jgi:hypothetical protein
VLHGVYDTNTRCIIHSVLAYRFKLYIDIQGEVNHRVNYILVEIHIMVKYTNKYVLENTTKHIIFNFELLINPFIVKDHRYNLFGKPKRDRKNNIKTHIIEIIWI